MSEFPIQWMMNREDLLFDEENRRFYWKYESHSEWTLMCVCEQKKPQNLAFIEIHRKCLAGESFITGELDLRTNRERLLRKKFMTLLENGCSFARIELQYSFNSAMPPKSLSLSGKITISESTGAVFDYTKIVHMTADDYSHLRELSADMGKIFLEKTTLADVRLRSGPVSYAAHKIVLSARSPVFEAMFQCRMMEAEDNVLVIDDIQPSVLQAMLNYMYTSKVENLAVSLASDLLSAASKYQIPGLEAACSAYLISKMSVNNIGAILNMADLMSVDVLDFASDFICNKCDSVSKMMKTRSWIELRNSKPDVVVKVLGSAVKSMKQELKLIRKGV